MIPPGPRLGSRFHVRSPAELGDRARQRIHTWLELFAGESRGQEPADDALDRVLLCEPRLLTRDEVVPGEKPRAIAFPAFLQGKHAGALARARHPDACARTIERADRAVIDRFDIFGRVGLSYGDPIDWHLDPLRRRRSPLVHWSRVPYLDVDLVGDHKVIWELNRHQHLVTLGQAYCLTGDERYASTIVRQLNEWMDANPPKLGINWSSSLELSFRAISWTWALHLVRESAALTPLFAKRVMKFLYIHARHIAAHLSTYFSPNTHLTGEALGLLYIGTCFDEFHDAPRWRELGWSILERELERQVRPDGIYFEQTTWYQRYTADFYLHALQLRERSGFTVGADTRQRISGIIDPLVHLTDPCGLTPLIGDDDGGQLLPLSVAEPNDFRSTLAHAAVLLQRSDCAALAASATSNLPWLVGEPGLVTFDAIEQRSPQETARLFADGGYFVARNRWAADADFLVVDCGPHGALSCGHAHADALSVVLTLAGCAVLVDPGTGSYVAPDRDQFRTTAAHNTLTVDDAPSSEPDRPFRWRSAAAGVVSRTIADRDFAFFEGEHDGYARLPDPVRARRAIFMKYGEFVAIHDTIETVGAHNIAGRFHFSPGLAVTRESTGQVLTALSRDTAEPLVDLFVVGRDVTLGVETGRVAPTYGITVDAQVGTFTSTGVGTREFWTLLVPRAGRRGAPVVLDAEPESGTGVVIRCDEYEDLVIAGEGQSKAGDLATDARCVWLRRTAARSQPTEFVVLDGSQLSVGGRTILSLPARRAHVRGRLLESGWELHVSPA